MADSRYEWHLPDQILHLDQRPLVMGIINVTPDSFSDGGSFTSVDAALESGLKLIDAGADIVDIGGESSRPGAAPISLEQETSRVLPVVQKLAVQTTVPLSIDTTKAAVARACLAAGARIVNDITALRGDQDMADVVRTFRAGVILMHMQGTPATMQQSPKYEDVVVDIAHFFETRLQDLAQQGIAPEQIVLDPGIGFGKTLEHNLELLARLLEFQRLNRPVCLGVSRKGFIGKVLNRPVDKRLAGSLAITVHAVSQGAAHIVRVHDVQETRDAVTMVETIKRFTRDSGRLSDSGRSV
jgi:dihydropteroate synthase